MDILGWFGNVDGIGAAVDQIGKLIDGGDQADPGKFKTWINGIKFEIGVQGSM